jgi:ribosomal-protein-serine acetyltransferase
LGAGLANPARKSCREAGAELTSAARFPKVPGVQSTFTRENVTLRRYQSDDAPLLFEAVRESVRELSAWMSWCNPSYSRVDSETSVRTRQTEWAQGERYSFVISDSATGRFLGGVGLNFINRAHKFANLGYWVRTSSTRRGVATAAVRLAAGFGLGELGLNRVEIVVATGNVPSQRVARKAGACSEGVLRQRLWLHDQSHDAVMFSLVAEDLK